MYINGINSPLGKSLVNYFHNNCINDIHNNDIAIFNGFKSPESTNENNIQLFMYNIDRIKTDLFKIKKLRLKKIIFISAISVYGDNWDGFSTNATPKNFDYYSLAKLESENIIFNYCKKENINFYTIRLPGICEPLCTRNFICKLINSIKNEKIPQISSPENFFNNVTCHEDICKVIKAIINNNIKFDIINLGATNPIRIIEIHNFICEYYNRKKNFIELDPSRERIVNIDNLKNSGINLNSVMDIIKNSLI